jgi:hypothetical protein
MIIHYCEQGSQEWQDLRLGRFTATDFATLANGKKATIDNLILKKAAEIVTGKKAYSDFYNKHMERGNELEAEAREAFELERLVSVEQVGFIEVNEFIGCSPDGLVGDYSGIEIKCKDNHTHLKTLLKGDNSYKWQIVGNMWCTGRKEWEFYCYNPNFTKQYSETWYLNDDDKSQLEQGLDYAVEKLKGLLDEIRDHDIS